MKRNMSKIFNSAFIALIALTVGARIFIECKYYSNSIDGLSRLIGSIMGAYLFSWIIWKYFFKKKAAYLLRTFAVLFILGSLNPICNKAKELAQLNNFKKEISNMHLSPNKKDSEMLCSREKYGKLSPFLELMKKQVTLDARDWERFDSEIEKANQVTATLKDLLNPKNLSKAIKHLEKALIYINEIENKTLKWEKEIPKKVQNLKAKEFLKKSFLKGFCEGKNNRLLHYKLLESIRNLIKKRTDYYLFLLEIKNSYYIKDNLLTFPKEKDVIKNNNFAQNIAKLAKETLKLYQQRQKTVSNAISNF